MGVIVQKFGGTSVADVSCFLKASDRVVREMNAGHRVVVVVSAMAGETNRLIELTRQISLTPDASEYDVILSSGEQVACGLFALALQTKGIRSRSLLGWQVPMKTCPTHAKARYQEILVDKIQEELAKEVVVVLPGFQGVSSEGRLTTLGRGGSDITAVATAAALKADACDIFTDVQGVYTADPRVVRHARLLKAVSYEEMVELSAQGAKVLQNRSVSLAMTHHVRVRVLSSFEEGPGTWIVPENEVMEKETIRGITHSMDEVLILLKGLKDEPGVGGKVLTPLAQGHIALDMIAHQISGGEKTVLSFTVAAQDAERAQGILAAHQETIGFETLEVQPLVAKVSVIGSGLRTHPQLISKAFEIFGAMGINILKTTTSELKLSFLIPQEYAELAVRSLHQAYELGEDKHT